MVVIDLLFPLLTNEVLEWCVVVYPIGKSFQTLFPLLSKDTPEILLSKTISLSSRKNSALNYLTSKIPNFLTYEIPNYQTSEIPIFLT